MEGKYTDKIKITRLNYDIYDKAEDLLYTRFMTCTNKDNFEGYIEVDSVESMIEELCDEINHLKERVDELEDPPLNDMSYPEEEYDREQYYEWKYGSKD